MVTPTELEQAGENSDMALANGAEKPGSATPDPSGLANPRRWYCERNEPGHFDSGGRVIIRFDNDDELAAIRALLAQWI